MLSWVSIYIRAGSVVQKWTR